MARPWSEAMRPDRCDSIGLRPSRARPSSLKKAASARLSGTSHKASLSIALDLSLYRAEAAVCVSEILTLEKDMGRGIILWMLGVPLPIILLLAMCSHN